MPLATVLADYIHAAFTGLYLESHEPDEALREIQQLCHQHGWTLAIWDIDRGLTLPGANSAAESATDPLAAIRSLPALATPDGTSLLVLKNFQRFLNSAEIVQALQHQLQAGKSARTFVVILAPAVQLPVELERLFVVVQHELPNREQLGQVARETVADRPQDVPIGRDWDALLDAAAGLTRLEAEGAFALSIARHDALRPDAVWEIKAQSLRKLNLLSLHRGGDTFAQLGGLEVLKDFCRRALQPGRTVKAKGTLLLSPPGCGKSAFCRALGIEVGRPVLSLDIGRLMDSLVGGTERNVRQALQIAEPAATDTRAFGRVDRCSLGTRHSQLRAM